MSAFTHDLTPGLSRIRRVTSRGCAWAYYIHLPLIVIATWYALAEASTAYWLGRPTVWAPLLYASGPSSALALAGALTLAVAYGLYVMLIVRPDRPVLHSARNLRGLVSFERLAMGAVVLVIVQVFASAVSEFKSMIPLIHGFRWDAWLARISPSLFGGKQTYQLLQPVFGHEMITVMLDRLYVSWFILVWTMTLWQAFSLRDLRLRSQFWISFFLTWVILGTLAATVLSSAGPCFYGRVTGLQDPFAPLMAYLHQVDATHSLFALKAQAYLWSFYQKDATGFGSGISAMPSMHVSVTTLLTLLGWRIHRGLGIGLTIYTSLILVGSVELGWHYLPDGIVAIVGTVAIWLVVGALLRRRGAGGLRASGHAAFVMDPAHRTA